MTTRDPKLVEVFRTPNLSAAHGMRLELEAEGFTVFMDGEMLQGSLGELPLGWATAVRILIAEPQAGDAKSMVKQIEARMQDAASEKKIDAISCLACGHVMQESDTRCSACGWTFLQVPQRTREDPNSGQD